MTSQDKMLIVGFYVLIDKWMSEAKQCEAKVDAIQIKLRDLIDVRELLLEMKELREREITLRACAEDLARLLRQNHA